VRRLVSLVVFAIVVGAAPAAAGRDVFDRVRLPAALSGTWDWLEQDLTFVTVAAAGHFVPQDASVTVTKAMKTWLGKPRRSDRR
jgi:hypothetical protein